MELDSELNISKESFMRLLLWESALKKAYMYLKVADGKFSPTTWVGAEYYEYMACGIPCGALVPAIAYSGLIDAALVLIGQVFSSGTKGTGIANNRKHQEVDRLREEMEQHAKNKLGWSSSEYESVFQMIKSQRDQQIAHYDGAAANYHEPAPGIFAMKIVGNTLHHDEMLKVTEFVMGLLDFLCGEARKYNLFQTE